MNGRDPAFDTVWVREGKKEMVGESHRGEERGTRGCVGVIVAAVGVLVVRRRRLLPGGLVVVEGLVRGAGFLKVMRTVLGDRRR